MKINSLSIISVIAVLTPLANANAGAIVDFYTGAMVGVGGQVLFLDHHDKTDSAFTLGALVGVDIPLFRIEAEYNHLASSDINANTAMLNAYFKVPSMLVTPYIGAGAGMVFDGKYSETIENVKTTYKFDTSPAYQGMLGLTIDVPVAPLKFDIEGRALYAPKVYEIALSGEKPDFLQYDVRLKMRLIF